MREDIHKFLLQACTTQDGALLQQSGWYPSGFDFEASTRTDDDGIDLGLDSPYYFDEYESAVPVRNANLSAFLQSLRPDKDTLQAELIVAIFEAAPELVADYFTKRPKFTSRPNDEAAWRGQVAFIFSVINLPVPHNCGAQDQISYSATSSVCCGRKHSATANESLSDRSKPQFYRRGYGHVCSSLDDAGPEEAEQGPEAVSGRTHLLGILGIRHARSYVNLLLLGLQPTKTSSRLSKRHPKLTSRLV